LEGFCGQVAGQKDCEWPGISIGEVLTPKLGSRSSFRLAERIKLSYDLKKIEFGQTGLVTGDTDPELRKMIGADVLMLGPSRTMGRIFGLMHDSGWTPANRREREKTMGR